MYDMSVEQMAVNMISDLIMKSPRLVPYISTNDKTPFTDGYIDLHSQSSKPKNETFLGRVSVQVKGRSLPKSGKAPKKFRISRIDLEGFLRDFGVLYFIVWIDQKKDRRIPFYALLNPFKIEHLLASGAPEQANFNVRFSPFPNKPESVEALVALAYRTRDERPGTVVDPQILDAVRSVTIHSDQEFDFDHPVLLTYADLDFSVELESEGGMKLPINGEFRITPSTYINFPTKLTIKSGDFIFRNPLCRRLSDAVVELTLSNGLKVCMPTKRTDETTPITFSPRRGLEEWYKDVGFYLACVATGKISVDDRVFEFKANPVDEHAELSTNFEYVSRFRDLFSAVGADSELVSIDDISEKRARQLEGLYPALVKGLELEHLSPELGRLRQPVGRWSLELICTRGTETGKAKYLDLFSATNGKQLVSVQEQNGDVDKVVRITPYDLLDEEWLPRTLNLHLENLVSAYKEVAEYPGTYQRANALLLKLIIGTVEVPQREDEFLDAAFALNEWLIAEEGSLPRHLINRWQILARKRPLTPEERTEIRTVKQAAHHSSSETPLLLEAACLILLGELEGLNFCLAQMSQDDNDMIQTWPIWTLRPSGSDARLGDILT